jgi:chemotaxis protein methyltransferase CheR
VALTYFFRDLGSLELAISHVMPQIAGRSRIRIWDAGCAMGQEPFTLAMLLAEALGPMMFRNVEIVASDYDPAVIQVLDDAVYADEELQRVPEQYFARYLDESGNEGTHRVAEAIRKAVRSVRHNLLSFTPVCDRLSLIVCKNVLLHFNQAERIKVFTMFHDALEPQGLLVTEHTQKLPPEVSHLFSQVTPQCQLFRRIEVPSPARESNGITGESS